MAIFKTKLFNDGEALEHGDLNDAQNYLRAQLWDTVGTIARLQDTGARNGTGVAIAEPADAVFAVGYGGAPMPHDITYLGNGTTRLISNYRGVVMQRVAGEPLSGNVPAMLAYYATEGEWAATLAANVAADPRCDIGVIRLSYLDGDSTTRHFEDATTRAKSSQVMNKAANVRCEFQVIQGVPDPLAPEPSVPSGWGKVWSATVYPGATVITLDRLRDHRFPIGTSHVDVPMSIMVPGSRSSGTWAIPDLNNLNYSIWLTGMPSGADVFVPALGARPSQRLLGVQFVTRNANSSKWVLGLPRGITGPDFDGGASNIRLDAKHHDVTEKLLPATASGNTTMATGLLKDVPLWGNGRTCGMAAALDGYTELAGMYLQAVSGSAVGDYLGLLRFTFAGSL